MTGSSPRVRGTLFAGQIGGAAQRFIPAGAGNTPSTFPVSWSAAVHPRGCGEHAWNFAFCCDFRRFIPAGAGNTRPRRLTGAPHAVHPRGCGEHLDELDRGVRAAGSSPRVRGTLGHDFGALEIDRFIPAGAGNTLCRRPHTGKVTVHPRGCGEHFGRPLNTMFSDGSSPRVRGTRRLRRLRVRRRRFIPAGAGNTSRARFRR